MLRLMDKLYYQCRISFHKRQRHIQMDKCRPRHYTVPRCYSYHKTLYTSHHTHHHHIQMDNFHLRDDKFPRCYSYHMSVGIVDRMCYPHILKTGWKLFNATRQIVLRNKHNTKHGLLITERNVLP